MQRDLKLRIILENPPAGVDFALQRGRGSEYESIQQQRSAARDLRFEFTVAARASRRDRSPAFHGPLVQGPTDARFIYIGVGTFAGQSDTCWSRRMKVPLSGITWEVIDRLFANPDAVLETRVPGTGKDGGPSCGTVKPFRGWKSEVIELRRKR